MKERISSYGFIFLQMLSGIDVWIIIQLFLQKCKCIEMQQICGWNAQLFVRGSRRFRRNIDLVRSALNIHIQNSALPKLFQSLGIVYFTISSISTLLFSTEVYLRVSCIPIKEMLQFFIVQHKTQLPGSIYSHLFYFYSHSNSTCIPSLQSSAPAKWHKTTKCGLHLIHRTFFFFFFKN